MQNKKIEKEIAFMFEKLNEQYKPVFDQDNDKINFFIYLQSYCGYKKHTEEKFKTSASDGGYYQFKICKICVKEFDLEQYRVT